MNTSLLARLILGVNLCLLTGMVFDRVLGADESHEQLFENSIRPILSETCFRCHGDAKAKVAGGLRVDSRQGLIAGGDSGPAIDVDKPAESLILRALRREADIAPMPPEKERALRGDQIAAFEKWIAAGAPWPEKSKQFTSREHWAFAPLLPKGPDATIDSHMAAAQAAHGRSMHSPADKRTLIRRATYDLTGLPPTPQELDAFEKDDSPDAYARLIDRLLESPQYGEKWARHWLDVVRYADTAGETADYPVPTAWRYRNYVIDAFNSDMPYDQFLREQIAGDVLAQNTSDPNRYAEQIVATGYLAISRRFGFDSENYHHLTIQDTIDTLGQSVLGLSLGCARCHDHKNDPISMQDYYGLYGIFDSSRYAFPGSEQKQKVRCLMPLVPQKEAAAGWRHFDTQVSQLRRLLESNRQPVPTAVLRSLADMDGDFELQAPAAGGSNGVLVPPWAYTGEVAVTNAAQSPYTNLYAPGKNGVSIAAQPVDGRAYSVEQAIYPKRSAGINTPLYFNLDFRLTDSEQQYGGRHAILLGDDARHPALLIQVDRKSIGLEIAGQLHAVGSVVAGQWINMQLELNPRSQQIVATVGTPESTRQVSIPWNDQAWSIDYVRMARADSGPDINGWPAIEFDNLGLSDQPARPVGSAAPALTDPTLLDQLARQADIEKELNELIGLDADFELQTPETPPSAPWGQGPNSVVKIAARAQSPCQEYFPLGELGVHMPNRGQYDGFGIQLPFNWQADTTESVYTAFDFRCADAAAGGDGSWRYYVGHGPGNSAAVELFFNAHRLYARSDNDRPEVATLAVGKWYQVQVTLNLREKKYRGVLRTLDAAEPTSVEFAGLFAAGWDGNIDYSFIDSYGHIGGVRPALDVDNYALLDKVPGRIDTATRGLSPQLANRRQRVQELKQLVAANKQLLSQEAERLNKLLIDGPFPMAYAVAEGTPHDVPLQLRGEPSSPGEVVPRSFIRVLGGGLPETVEGSGRLELARWLTEDTRALTARVMVNRIWQYHFGRGLVATPNDFGVRGAQPSNPALLDYLADRFIESGWRVKAMHRLIMLSQTYQQSAADQLTGDGAPPPELLVGFARRRLSAEEIRDAILCVSGLLDKAPGQGHAFPAPINWGYTQHGPFAAVYEHRKRSIYLMTQRLKRHPFLALFDGADPNASTALRLGSTVPTQALYFLNDPFVHEASNHWASLIQQQVAQAGGDAELQEPLQIQTAYRTALARFPEPDELGAARDFMQAYREELIATGSCEPQAAPMLALAAWLRALIGSNEFLHID